MPQRVTTEPQPPGTRPGLLAIMGSGETSPTMVKVHRDLIDRLAAGPAGPEGHKQASTGSVPAVLLDTPYGFQENASDLSARTQHYFRTSVGHDIGVATLRGDNARQSAQSGQSGQSGAAADRAVARIREASYVFAGPGSPTYALRVWRGTGIPAALADTLSGGCVTFASAAALTLGVLTLPVYEIYKAGEPPRWLEGLDLLAVAGLRCAVIPHYDNTEGGTHDTRYCYLGERRLRMLEAEMPDDAFVLGVDEHTAGILDLGARTVEIVGRGCVTVRRRGVSTAFDAGVVPLDELISGRAAGATTGRAPLAAPVPSTESAGAGLAAVGLAAAAREWEDRFSAALAESDMDSAVDAVLGLEAELQAWSADPLQSDEADQARDILRAMIVRLGELATAGTQLGSRLSPFVDALVQLRDSARAAGRFAEADEVRDRLVALGVEVRDAPAGTQWSLPGQAV